MSEQALLAAIANDVYTISRMGQPVPMIEATNLAEFRAKLAKAADRALDRVLDRIAA